VLDAERTAELTGFESEGQPAAVAKFGF